MAHPAVVTMAVTSSVIGVGAESVAPLLTATAVDRARAGSTQQLVTIVAGLGGIALLRFGSAVVRRYFGGRLSLDVQHDLRRAVFGSVQRLDGPGQDRLRTGQVVARTISDLQRVQGLLAMIPLALGTVVYALLALVFMAQLSPLLTVVALVVLPVALVVSARSRFSLFPATWSAQQRAADLAQHVEETVTGVRVVKGFGQEHRETRTLQRAAHGLFSERMRAARLTAPTQATLTSLPGAGQVAVLCVGGILALRGQISLGVFLAFATYISSIIGPARLIAGLVVTAQLARAGVERVYGLIDARPEITESPSAVEVGHGPLGVEFAGVSFGYSDGEPVLRELDLRIGAGETLALVGTSGSGKSTLAQLLGRFYDPDAGCIRLDAEGGSQDLRQLQVESLRRAVVPAFDEPFLFSDTIAANISYGRPEADRAQIERAARAAAAHEFITELPQGYDTPTGERGLTLSGGQRQRIALARALLSDPRVLVVDDAISAVDAATEAEIGETLLRVARDRTMLLIATRRSTLAMADRIAVLQAGRVVDIGTEEQLWSRCPEFARLFSSTDRSQGRSAGNGRTSEAKLWPERDRAQPAASAQRTDTGGLPPSPRLLAAVEKLPSATATPRTGAMDPQAADPAFRLRRMLQPVRWLLLITVLLVGADSAATVALPSLVRLGVSRGVDAGVLAWVWIATALAAAVVLADWVVTALQTRSAARVGETVLYTLRVRCYAHLQRLGIDYYERERSGRIMTRMTTDVDALSNFLQTGLTTAMVSLLTLVGITVTLLITDVELALVALAGLPLLAAATVIFRRRSAAAYTEARNRISTVNADMQENVAGLRVAQAHTRERIAAANFGSRSLAYRRSRLRAQRYIALYFPFVTMISELAAAAVLAVGASRVATGQLSSGVLLAFLLYLRLFFSPVQQLSQVFDGYQQARVGLHRIGELLSTPSSVAVPEHPLPVPRRFRGDIRLREVGFEYPGAERPALRGIQLDIPAGQTLAVVGSTGAGKSTVLKLLARLQDPTSGAVLLDGTDLRCFAPQQLRSRLGVVPQEGHLFTGTVAENIRYPRPDAGDAEVERAAAAVGALPMISCLPAGMHQQVGERGRGLSAGERQLVALARAEMADPDVLILDEATAALEITLERSVLEAMRLAGSGRTTVVVAHRLATAAAADRVVVLRRGELVEVGTHEQLLHAGGSYRELWNAHSVSVT